MVRLLLSAAVAALSIGSASAQVAFNVNATFFTAPTGGTADGTLTGTFTTNNALSAITSYNLVASSFGSFAGFTYTPANSSVTAAVLPSQYFQIDSTGNVNELRLYFTTPLTAAGATINPIFSYENEPSGGNRYPVGTITRATAAVPEPAAWALMILGFGAVGYSLRRRPSVHFAQAI